VGKLPGSSLRAQEEINYLEKGLYRSHFPDVWERVVQATPKEFQAEPVSYHMKQILEAHEPDATVSAKIINSMEGAIVSLDDRFTPPSDEDFDPVPTTIEAHYMSHGCFLSERHILSKAHVIQVPVWLVQGRYDFVTTPAIAYELHTRLPNSNLLWTQAGHGNDRSNYEVMHTLMLQASVEHS
jgi:proline iminopeptidase